MAHLQANLQVWSREPVHPHKLSLGKTSTTPVSIADSAVAEYAPTAGTWFFPNPAPPHRPPLGDSWVVHLLLGLRRTLAGRAYRHLCGQLTLDPAPDAKNYPAHASRYGRAWVYYGHEGQPGVGWTTARYDGPVTDVLPRSLGNGVWDSSPVISLCDASKLVKLRPTFKPGPGVTVQVTTFADGSLAVGIAAHHALLDARGLSTFMSDWARNSKEQVVDSLPAQRAKPQPPRPFIPLSLDAAAAGDVEADIPDPAILAKADTVPQLRLDFWARREGHPEDYGPEWFSSPRDPPERVTAMDVAAGCARGRRVPWEDWRFREQVLDRTMDFTPAQVQALHSAAADASLSRLDAVLGAVWAAVVRARDLPPDTEVRLHTSIDLRRRVTPQLDEGFIGAPLINITSTLSPATLTPAAGARAIRSTLSTLTQESIGAVLHRMAFAIDPVREWNCFLGERDVLTTSWLGSGCYNVDFVKGGPMFVQPTMPPVDGLLVAMDTPETKEGSRWWQSGGVKVRVMLRKEVMRRVLDELRGEGEREVVHK